MFPNKNGAGIPSGRVSLFDFSPGGGLRPPTPASVSILHQRGESPRQGLVLNPVSESNCVLVRGSGEQLEENGQSAG